MTRTTTWVVVADGAKARIYCNTGPGTGLSPVEERSAGDARKPTRALGADKPGRSFESHEKSRHAISPHADWHDEEKHHFLGELASHLNQEGQKGSYDALTVVAPPEALGLLRQGLDANTSKRVAGELAKDLTNTPGSELRKALKDTILL